MTKKLGFHTLGVQPAVLRWARESQGYSLDDVGIHLKRDIGDIVAWESGTASPTYAQLEKLAYGLYKRPLAVFFLPAPPREPKVKQEFRTLPDIELDRLAADTRYQIRLAHAYRISLRELSDGVNPSPRKIFREVQLTHQANVLEAARQVRGHLKITLDEQSAWKDSDEALKAWRTAVEADGVFVFKHSFKQKNISGFCLADDEFPIIYLNNSTAKTRQIFSLFHELVHLLMKVNAISTLDDACVQDLPPREQRIEQFCNALAAEILVPSEDFDAQLFELSQSDDEAVQRLARRYHVSREAILRRFLDRGMVDRAQYEAKAQRWAVESENDGTGGNYYATQSAYLGERYMQIVFAKHYQGKLDLEQVADYLGVRTRSVAGIEARLFRNLVSA